MRAVRPVTMAARLGPYLRYYSSHRPTDDHGAQPMVLIVFDDELAATPLPARGRRRDGPDEDRSSPAGLLPRPAGAAGAAGTRVARSRRRLGAGPPAVRPLNINERWENESHEAVLHPLRSGRGPSTPSGGTTCSAASRTGGSICKGRYFGSIEPV